MTQGGFVVAMAAAVSVAVYDRPTEIIRRMRRWAIVSRFGAENEYLTISIAGAMQHEQVEAPIGLAPIKTAFGILLSENKSECQSMFLLVRQLPRGIKIAGFFFPAEGYARLNSTFNTLYLHTEGRHAHSRGLLNGYDIRIDVPDPAPGAKWAMAWHIEAAHRPWAGEFFASARTSR
jgi:hypothetical protein